MKRKGIIAGSLLAFFLFLTSCKTGGLPSSSLSSSSAASSAASSVAASSSHVSSSPSSIASSLASSSVPESSAVTMYSIDFLNFDGTVLQSSQWKEGDTPVYSGATPTRKGTDEVSYEFSGWSPEIAVVSKAASYIAQYTSTINQYTVTFEDYDGRVIDSKVWSYGALPTCEAPTRAADRTYSYEFSGWNPTVHTVDRDITYKAVYASTLLTYSITYVLNGGTNDSGNPSIYTGLDTFSLKDPTKTGHEFSGWYFDAEFTQAAGKEATGWTGDITLYAKWAVINYSITYVLDGGVNASSNPATYTYTDPTITLAQATKQSLYSISQGTLTSTDYSFEGWFKDAAFTEAITSIPAGSMGDITLYAYFTYTVSDTSGIYSRVDDSGNASTTGSYLLFGSYPQTQVTDTTVISGLTAAAGTLPTSTDPHSFTAYPYYQGGSNATAYMWYQDIDYQDELYRAVYFTAYRPTIVTYSSNASASQQDDDGYLINNLYFFHYDPIKWRILSEENNTAFVLAEVALDAQEFNSSRNSSVSDGKTYLPNDYAHSSLRSYLNGTFLNRAFDISAQQFIFSDTVDNSLASAKDKAGALTPDNVFCEDTQDKVFPLSVYEVTDENYGFTGYNDENTDNKRKRIPTAYAKSQGCYRPTSQNIDTGIIEILDNCMWWLRTPGINDSDHVEARVVGAYYSSPEFSNWIDSSVTGIVPAMKVNLG
jgi:uncharacterized repeat protein (TIGR02543 family)